MRDFEKSKFLNKAKKIQSTLRWMASIVPTSKKSLLLPAEPFGPGMESFQDQNKSLIPWIDKQNQRWCLHGVLKTTTGRNIFVCFDFRVRQLQKDFFGVLPLKWFKDNLTSAYLILSDYQNAESKKAFSYWQKANWIEKTSPAFDRNQIHLQVGGWHFFQSTDSDYQLICTEKEYALILSLKKNGPQIFHGQNGYYLRNSDQYSYYCSVPEISVQGKVHLNGEMSNVSGQLILEHEKYSGQFLDLEPRLTLSFKVDNQKFFIDLINEKAQATLVDKNNEVKYFVSSEVRFEFSEYWTSPKSKLRYPVKYKVQIESLELSFDVRPYSPQRELGLETSRFGYEWVSPVLVFGKYGSTAFEVVGSARKQSTNQTILGKAVSFLSNE